MRVVVFFALLLVAVSGHAIPGSHWLDAHDLPKGVSDAPAVIVNNIIYLAGGCVSISQPATAAGGPCPNVTSQQIMLDLNQANPNWTVLAPMPRIRYRQGVAAVGNLIYHVGGRDPQENIIVPIDVYNITSGTWSTLPNQTCNCVNFSDPASFSIGTKLYVTGGYSIDYSTTFSSTIVLDTTFPIPNQQFQAGVVPNLPWRLGDLGAITVNGLGYVLGGWGPDNGCIPLNRIGAYDPSTNKWTEKTPFVHPRGDMAVAAIGKYIYVSGGENKAAGCVFNASAPDPYSGVTPAAPVADVERYDVTTDSWVDYAPIALQSFRFTGIAFQDVLYDIGGQGEVTTMGNDSVYPLIPEVYYLNTTTYDAFLANSTNTTAAPTTPAHSSAFTLSISSIIMAMVACVGACFL